MEFFKYGTVGRASGNRCLYPEADGENVGGAEASSSLAPSADARR